MPYINIFYKVPADAKADVHQTLQDHANYMKATYVKGSDSVHPIHTYFTEAPELNNPVDPNEGLTGFTVFTLNEIWNKLEDIQAHVGRVLQAPHAERFGAAWKYANLSVMGEIFFQM